VGRVDKVTRHRRTGGKGSLRRPRRVAGPERWAADRAAAGRRRRPGAGTGRRHAERRWPHQLRTELAVTPGGCCHLR